MRQSFLIISSGSACMCSYPVLCCCTVRPYHVLAIKGVRHTQLASNQVQPHLAGTYCAASSSISVCYSQRHPTSPFSFCVPRALVLVSAILRLRHLQVVARSCGTMALSLSHLLCRLLRALIIILLLLLPRSIPFFLLLFTLHLSVPASALVSLSPTRLRIMGVGTLSSPLRFTLPLSLRGLPLIVLLHSSSSPSTHQ